MPQALWTGASKAHRHSTPSKLRGGMGGILLDSEAETRVVRRPKKERAMIRTLLAPAIAITLCALIDPAAALGQTTTGSIVGTVSDASGGTVPGATVTVTNEETGIIVVTSVTDQAGNYVATALPRGRYTVAVEASGFKRSVKSGINLSVQDRIGLNVVLEVGQVSETVEVVGSAPLLQTDTSYLG